QNSSQEAILATIKQWYNGYRFTKTQACVYNPFSTLKYIKTGEMKSYWYSTGTPSFLIEQIQKYPKNLLPLGGIEVSDNRLSGGSKIDYIDVATLMFQTGYLTITDYSELERAYRLDFPNREVREAFLDSLLNELTDIDSLSVVRSAAQLRAAFEALDIAGLIKTLNIHFAKIAYHAHREQTQRLSEGFYQAVFFTFLERSGIETKVEEATSRGRIDMVVQLSNHVFIFELKVDQTAEIALDQVHDQGYKERYLEAGREIVVVGINFSTQSRDINEWKAGIYAPEGTLIREL
ncbi:MAG: PD-(D/E)XK nuclease domain-containing protein, partial [Bacteroidota bacterium]